MVEDSSYRPVADSIARGSTMARRSGAHRSFSMRRRNKPSSCGCGGPLLPQARQQSRRRTDAFPATAIDPLRATCRTVLCKPSRHMWTTACRLRATSHRGWCDGAMDSVPRGWRIWLPHACREALRRRNPVPSIPWARVRLLATSARGLCALDARKVGVPNRTLRGYDLECVTALRGQNVWRSRTWVHGLVVRLSVVT